VDYPPGLSGWARGTAGATVAAAGPIGSWEAALTIAASDASAEQPIVLVFDELPFLIESEPAMEAIIQKQWDRTLEAQPVLLLLIGSDVSTMAALNDYGRPIRGAESFAVVPRAGHAIGAGLVDECHLFLCPIVVGGGKRALPDNVRAQLELLDERRFRNGVVHLHYRVSV
jgi:hypothetical protein